jgi:hypothetical protein
MTAPMMSDPAAAVVIAGSWPRVSPFLANSVRTTITAPNDIRIPPIPIKAAANPERIGSSLSVRKAEL